MNRILIVAQSEFLTLVKTKAFLIGLLMMPIITAGAIGFQIYAQKHSDRDDHKFVVIDRSGVLLGPLQSAAAAFNAKNGDGGAPRTGPHFVPEAATPSADADADGYKLSLSDQIKKKALFAFVEIPAGVVDPSVEKGLVTKKADGSVAKAKATDPIATFVAPFAVLFIMFLSVMASAPQLLNAVIEEKMSRISEVLVASVSPFELLLGKLFGVTAIAVLLALFYFLGAGYYVIYSGHVELMQPALMGWFVLFLICCVLMFGSMFLAIGSACSDLKDAQSMMQPVMMLLMVGYIGSFAVLRAPESNLALGLSFFPTSAPFIMMLRMAMQPTPPLWQPALALGITMITTVAFVWVASRIFRVGVLMQGKGATFAEMLKWIRQS